MYRTFAEMWEGWTKNLYLLYGRNLGRILGTLAEVVLFDLILPLLFLGFCGAFILGYGHAVLATITAALFAMSLWWQWSYSEALKRLGFDSRLANYSFPGAALFSLLLINSALVYRLKNGVKWKGRTYAGGQQGGK